MTFQASRTNTSQIDGAHNFLELGKDVLTEPSVYRTLSVPSTATAEQLKTAIQLVFGYTGESSSDFLIWNPAYVKFDYYDWLMTQAKVKAHTVEGNKHTIEVEENTKPTSTLLHVVEQSVQDAYTKPMRWDSRKMAVLRYSDRTPWVLMKDMKVSGFFEEGQKFPQSGKYSISVTHDLERPSTDVIDRLSNLQIRWNPPLRVQLWRKMGSQD